VSDDLETRTDRRAEADANALAESTLEPA
jgi:hypothetical protein